MRTRFQHILIDRLNYVRCVMYVSLQSLITKAHRHQEAIHSAN